MSVVLIGYRGTGKSTVARLLAKRWNLAMVDADCEVESRAGRSIAEIFAEQGESAFRDWETSVLRDLVAKARTVVAAGGGAVLREENREIIETAQWIVWLRATPKTIARRVSADATTNQRRPQLTTAGGLREIVELLQQREPLYRRMAQCAVDTDGLSADEVVEQIARQTPEHIQTTTA